MNPPVVPANGSGERPRSDRRPGTRSGHDHPARAREEATFVADPANTARLTPKPPPHGTIESTYPPSTRTAPPVVADASGELR